MFWWVDKLPASWRHRYTRWLDRRIPPSQAITLDHGNLFIFPNRQGLYFLFLVILVWIGATNYQNNLAYALSFLLVAILLVGISLTFANLSGLVLRFVDADPVFAGERARFRFEAQSRANHWQLRGFFAGEPACTVDVAAHVPQRFVLEAQAPGRGLWQPGRCCLDSVYPLGLVRCWTWLNLGPAVLVYPQPLEADYRDCMAPGQEEDGVQQAGSEEYFALKPYVEGESRARIAWKQYAAGRGLQVRDYVDFRGGEIWLDFSALRDPDSEGRLSRLCYCALQLHAVQRPFGLRLPGVELAPATGDTHLRAVLRALALY